MPEHKKQDGGVCRKAELYWVYISLASLMKTLTEASTKKVEAKPSGDNAPVSITRHPRMPYRPTEWNGLFGHPSHELFILSAAGRAVPPGASWRARPRPFCANTDSTGCYPYHL